MAQLTINEVAATLGLARSTIDHQIRNGRLAAKRRLGVLVVTEREVERYRRESLGRPGRKRGA